MRELTLLNQGVRVPQYTLQTGIPPTVASDESRLRTYLSSAISSFQFYTIAITQAQDMPPTSVTMYYSPSNYSVFDLSYANT